MLRIFRQVRKQYIEKQQVRRYLFYAMGELILVVIGILIALQANNCNERRQLEDRQSEMLLDIRSDLQETLEGLQFGKRVNEYSLEQYRYVMGVIDKNGPYSEKIDSAIAWIPIFHVPRFTKTTYESLKSQGIDILLNPSLRQQIANLYENEYPYLSEDQTQLEWSMHNTTKPIYMNRYLRFRDHTRDPLVYPVDFEKIKADQGFIHFLAELIVVRAAGVTFYEETIKATETVILAIDREVERLKE